jgi:kynurenine formamidase
VLVDLSHTIEDGMGIYPILPPPRIGAMLDHESSRERYEGKAEFHLGQYDLSGATGTYLDSPFHRHREAPDLSALDLDGLVGLPGVVLRHGGPGREVMPPPEDGEIDVRGRAVLLNTGWAARWGTDAYWHGSPFLGGALLDRLVDERPALVGIDTGNIDDVDDLTRPAHTRLLAMGIPIVENLADLSALPREGFRFTAVPPRIVGGSNFPVRAFAEV